MFRHVEMHNPSAIVAQDDQHEQDTERGCGHREEIKCDELLDVAVEKRPLSLRWWV